MPRLPWHDLIAKFGGLLLAVNPHVNRFTLPLVAETQTFLLDLLKTADPAHLHESLPPLIDYLRTQVTALHTGQIPPEKLVCTTVLSWEPAAYRVPSPGARAAQGKRLRPGLKVRFLHTHPRSAV